jgi:glutathione S-transferase
MRLYDYAASGNCYKARLLLALLAQPYERVAVDIFAGDTLTDAYAAINPARETRPGDTCSAR